MAKTQRVKGIVSCGGLWGSLLEGQVLELDINIAESLMNGGLAVAVDENDEPLPAKKNEPVKKSKKGNAS